MVRRRAFLIIVVILVGCSLSILAAASRQHEYEASEVLQIRQPKIADGLASTTVEGSSARRLQSIQQRLMTRDALQDVIDRYGLYTNLPGLTRQEKVALLRESVRIQGVAAARDGYADDGTISVLTITARMETPELAQQVAHEFGQRTLELSERNRIENARETLQFFEVQERQLAAEIDSLEDEAAAYRSEVEPMLPGNLEFRREEIATINSGLLDIARERVQLERAIDLINGAQRQATAERQRRDLEEQLATLDAQVMLLNDTKSELESLIEASPDIERRLGAYDRRLEQLREELSMIAARKTDAELGFQLESEHRSERLTVIEEAAVPDYPVTQSRKRIAMLGGIASVFLAFGLAYLREIRNPVLRSANQMEKAIGLRPVVTVPFLKTRRRRRWFRALFARGNVENSAPAE